MSLFLLTAFEVGNRIRRRREVYAQSIRLICLECFVRYIHSFSVADSDGDTRMEDSETTNLISEFESQDPNSDFVFASTFDPQACSLILNSSILQVGFKPFAG